MTLHSSSGSLRRINPLPVLAALLALSCLLTGTAEAGNKKIADAGLPGSSERGRASDPGREARLAEEVYNFTMQLTKAFQRGDIDAFISFYSKDASENGMAYAAIKEHYSSLFGKGASGYSISGTSISEDSEGIKLSGTFVISGPEGVLGKGIVSMLLIRENGNLKIFRSRMSEEEKKARSLISAMEKARSSGGVEIMDGTEGASAKASEGKAETENALVHPKAAEAEKRRLAQAMHEAESSGAVEIEKPAAGPVSPPLLPKERRNRIELEGTFEYLHPHGDFGDWGNITASFYRRERPDFTWFVQLGAHSRKEGDGMLAAAGAYKDWTESLFTYTALAAGSSSDYLPQFRADQDFNLRLGPQKNFVWVVGGTYIQYFGDHRDYIASTGLSAYIGKWVAEYRVFRNISDPGSKVSYSQLFGLSYGQDGRQWTYGKFSFGRQAYLATNVETPEAVSNNSVLASLGHRRWLGKDYGVFGEMSWFKLSHSYQKYGLTIGVFKEF